MEHNENQAVITFDTLYTNNHIQILKILLPYFDENSRKKLAILIKFMELRYTMEYFSRHMALECAGEADRDGRKDQPDIIKIFEQIKSFCSPSERAMFDQLANMKKSMEMYEEMMNMMQLFSQLSPEGAMPFGGSGKSPSSDSGGKEDAGCGDGSSLRFDGGCCTDFDSGSFGPSGQESASASAADFDQSSQQSIPFGNANPMEMLKGMLSPEQQAMFEMFQSSFGSN